MTDRTSTPAGVVRIAARAGAADCCAIAVMAKASHPGRTKTRLSPPLTLEQAAELNTVFLRDIAENVARAAERADIACYMAFGPPGAAAFFEHHWQADVGLLEAWMPNFGDCLFHTVRRLLGMGYGAACVLNSDSPTLPTSVLVETAQALQRPGDRIVVGPCIDGGYYLLGMKQAHRRLFEHVAWSTEHVFRQTLERAVELRLETVQLPVWYDVDDSRSLQSLVRETRDGVSFSSMHRSHEATHTAAFLRRGAGDGSLPDIGDANLSVSVMTTPANAATSG
ncbi:MAG: TIGR04282 family arsenosugar biosynthesis glycosyltransferase [Steroidobacteraceae bacterium]|jgi:rSAM/selenodomain-associated transferase 1